MRRTPHSIKKDPKIWDMSTGTLKEGYTFHPVNEGYEQVSSIKTQKRTGAGKDGTNWQITGEKAIYKDGPSPKAAPAEAPVPPPSEPEPEPEAPVVLSDNAAKAKAYVKAYENIMLPRQGDYTAGGDKSVITDFGTEYDLQLGRAKQPQTEENMVISEEEARKNMAQTFADKYKQEVTDIFKS